MVFATRRGHTCGVMVFEEDLANLHRLLAYAYLRKRLLHASAGLIRLRLIWTSALGTTIGDQGADSWLVRSRIRDTLWEVTWVGNELVVAQGRWVAHLLAVAVDLIWIDNDLLAILVQRLGLFVDVFDVAVDFGVLLDLVFLLLVLQLRRWVFVPLASIPTVLVLHAGLLRVVGDSLGLVEYSAQSTVTPARHWLVGLVDWRLTSRAVLSLTVHLVCKGHVVYLGIVLGTQRLLYIHASLVAR